MHSNIINTRNVSLLVTPGGFSHSFHAAEVASSLHHKLVTKVLLLKM